MQVEIIFHCSTEPAKFDVDFWYIHAGCVKLQFPSGIIRAFPIHNVFSLAYVHGPHLGTRRVKEKPDAS